MISQDTKELLFVFIFASHPMILYFIGFIIYNWDKIVKSFI